MRGVSRIIILTMGLACPVSLLAAPQAQSAPADSTAQPLPTFTIDQVVTDTVSEAWSQGGKTETGFFAIVETMAQFAAQKRALTLPDSAADGRRMGQYIKQQAHLDHQQLLYPIVDKAVRLVGKPAPADTSATAPAPKQ
jgi:LPS sulfotransferase NodH